MKKIIFFFMACSILILTSCDERADVPPPLPAESPSPEPMTLTEPLPEIQPDTVEDPVAGDMPQLPLVDEVTMPAGPIEVRIQYFLEQSVDNQSRLAFEMEDSAESIELATLLLRENISPEIKIDLLSSLEYTESTSILPLLRKAIQDASPEVVVAALRILYQHATTDDLPQLQLLAGTSQDDEVRDAAQDVIDSLQP